MCSEKFLFEEIETGNEHLKCRCFTFHESLKGRILADGNVDFLLINSGNVFWLGPEQKKFSLLTPYTAFPLGESWSSFYIEAGTELINLKVRPDLVRRDLLLGLTWKQPVNLFDVLHSNMLGMFRTAFHQALSKGDVSALLTFIIGGNESHSQLLSQSFNIIMEAFTGESDLTSSVSEIFLNRGYSYKKIARDFKQSTGIPLKRYFDTLRFHRAIDSIRRQGHQLHGNVVEALRYGYYDQSHFVKSSRSISGLNPSSLIKHLPKGASDFLVSRT